VFREIDDYLSRNLTDFVVLDFEDYVQPRDLKAALVESGLYDRIRTMDAEQVRSVPFGYLLAAKKGKTEQRRRVLTVSEKHGGVYKWLPPTYALFQETPYTFSKISDFTCATKRGQAGNPMFLVNHWLRPNGPPDPAEASKVNSRTVLLDRFRRCAARRKAFPNVVAVDFTEIGALQATVRELNSAVAKATGTTFVVDQAIRNAFASGALTEAEAREIRGLHRLPRLSRKKADALLGPARAYLTVPASLGKLAADNCVEDIPASGLSPGPAIPPAFVVPNDKDPACAKPRVTPPASRQQRKGSKRPATTTTTGASQSTSTTTTP
jgi:hypothetical protein